MPIFVVVPGLSGERRRRPLLPAVIAFVVVTTAGFLALSVLSLGFSFGSGTAWADGKGAGHGHGPAAVHGPAGVHGHETTTAHGTTSDDATATSDDDTATTTNRGHHQDATTTTASVSASGITTTPTTATTLAAPPVSTGPISTGPISTGSVRAASGSGLVAGAGLLASRTGRFPFTGSGSAFGSSLDRVLVSAAAPPASAAPARPAPRPAYDQAVGDPMVLAAGAWRGPSLQAATDLGIPIAVLLAAGIFMIVQALIDRRDPKVAAAPQRGSEDTVPFE